MNIIRLYLIIFGESHVLIRTLQNITQPNLEHIRFRNNKMRVNLKTLHTFKWKEIIVLKPLTASGFSHWNSSSTKHPEKFNTIWDKTLKI